MNVSTLSDEAISQLMDERFYDGQSDIEEMLEQFGKTRWLELWSLTGPLMVEYKIQLTPMAFEVDSWNAYATRKAKNYNHGAYNPLRAICECVLMVEIANE